MSRPESNSDAADASPIARRRSRWLIALIGGLLLLSLPRPGWIDVPSPAPESSPGDATSASTDSGRWSFRSARQLVELAGKGNLADETELSGPCFTNDGQALLFVRSRPGQRADIVRSRRDGEHWTRPEPIRELNSVDDDRRPTVDANNRSLVFASNRSGTRGGFDLFESVSDSGRWRRPKNVGSQLNSSADEFDPTLTPDGTTLFFSRRAESGSAELFVSRRERIGAEWSSPEPLSKLNSADAETRSPTASADGLWLYFVRSPLNGSPESALEQLFRTPLIDGRAGEPQVISDRALSNDGLSDLAFSPNGQIVVYSSRREGGRRLFASQADWVVPQFHFSTAHLERFGRAKWLVPGLLGVAFVSVILWKPRASSADSTKSKVAAAAKSKAATSRSGSSVKLPVQKPAVDRPAQRSAPAKNPLDNWQVAAPEAARATSPAKAQTGKPTELVAKTAKSTESKSSVAKSPIASQSLSKRQVFVVATLAILALIAVWPNSQLWFISRLSSPAERPPVDLSEWATLREPGAVTRAELSQIDRSKTTRETAPEPSPLPLIATTLRQTARWPADLVVVRQANPIEAATQAAPTLIGITQRTAVPRLPAQSPRADLLNVAPEPTVIGITQIASEVPDAKPTVKFDRAQTSPPTQAGAPSAAIIALHQAMPRTTKTIVSDVLTETSVPKSATVTLIGGTAATSRANLLPVAAADVEPIALASQTNSDLVIAPNITSLSRGSEVQPNRQSIEVISVLTSVPPFGAPSELRFDSATPIPTSTDRLAPIGRNAGSRSEPAAAPPESATGVADPKEPTLLLTSATTLVELLNLSPLTPLERKSTASNSSPSPTQPVALLAAAWLRQFNTESSPSEYRLSSSPTTSPNSVALPRQIKESGAAPIADTIQPIFE